MKDKQTKQCNFLLCFFRQHYAGVMSPGGAQESWAGDREECECPRQPGDFIAVITIHRKPPDPLVSTCPKASISRGLPSPEYAKRTFTNRSFSTPIALTQGFIPHCEVGLRMLVEMLNRASQENRRVVAFVGGNEYQAPRAPEDQFTAINHITVLGNVRKQYLKDA
ncbi:hypothetical protein SRHO_G00015410 [Serrasalmus rhombeus]